MKKNTILVLVFITALILTSSCSRTQENILETTIFEQMQKNRIQYVGDISGVSILLNLLPIFDENYNQNMFSVQTQNKPYGIFIYYEPSEHWNGDNFVVTDAMTLYAKYLLEFIENLNYIEFLYRTSSSNGNLVKSEYQTILRVE